MVIINIVSWSVCQVWYELLHAIILYITGIIDRKVSYIQKIVNIEYYIFYKFCTMYSMNRFALVKVFRGYFLWRNFYLILISVTEILKTSRNRSTTILYQLFDILDWADRFNIFLS